MTTNQDVNATTTQVKEPGAKKKSSFGSMFLHFLMYGGWILIIVVIVGIIVAVQMLTK